MAKDAKNSAKAAAGRPPRTSGHTSIVKSSLVMFLGTFTSRILGMIRSPILLTLVLGLNSPIANSFDIANKLPNIIFSIIAGGLINAVLVPSIVKASSEQEDAGNTFINKLLTISIVILGALTFLLTLATPLVVKAFAASLNQEWYEMTVIFAYWCLPQIFFYGLYAIVGEILNARENFGPYMWSPVLNNVVAILGLFIILGVFGSASPDSIQNASVWQSTRGLVLVGFSTAGVASQALILFWPLHRSGIRFRPDFAWRNSGLGAAGKASLWVLSLTLISLIPTALETNVSAGAMQRALNAGIDTALVAGNAASSVSYAICGLPTSLITVSISTAMFTRLAKAARQRNYQIMRKQAAYTVNTISAFNFLALSLIITLAFPVSRVFVPAGSAGEIASLAHVIIPMSFSLLGTGVTIVYNRVCYSLNDMRGAFFMALPGQAVMIVGYLLCSFLPPTRTVSGVGVVMSLSTATTGILLILYSRKLLRHIYARDILWAHLKLALIALLITIPGVLAIHTVGIEKVTGSFLAAVATILVVTPIMGTFFLLLLKLFRVRELRSILQALAMVAGKLGLKSLAARISDY